MNTANSARPCHITTVKKTLSAGRGPVPEYRAGTKAIFHYEALKPQDDVDFRSFPDSRDAFESIDNTRKSYPDGYGKPLELIFGKKFQLPVFETCLRSMLVNEISQFDIHVSELFAYPSVSQKLRDVSKSELNPNCEDHYEGHRCAVMADLGTGYPVLDELMKKPRSLRFIFHLLQVLQPEDYEADSWQLDPEQKLASVAPLREAGNDLFRKGDIDEALKKYREALSRVDSLLLREKPGDSEWLELDKLNINLYLNISQCCLKLGNFYEAIEAANETLKRDDNNEKALYRRAKARAAVWDLESVSVLIDRCESCFVKDG
ncbi:hypothetical protein AB6A40_005850 [Gnathostoma spinigerum]|uniref:AIP/AIPL N-terminal FKBP-type PPIase domain-containing protein n=1 Tax=Gnathostoma spinigerum TaxID=75299 RepID=A0ABD6EIQ6_9BILA